MSGVALVALVRVDLGRRRTVRRRGKRLHCASLMRHVRFLPAATETKSRVAGNALRDGLGETGSGPRRRRLIPKPAVQRRGDGFAQLGARPALGEDQPANGDRHLGRRAAIAHHRASRNGRSSFRYSAWAACSIAWSMLRSKSAARNAAFSAMLRILPPVRLSRARRRVDVAVGRRRREHPPPDRLARRRVRERELDDEADAAQEGAVERALHVGGQDRQPAIGLHALQQVADLDVGVAVVAVLAPRCACRTARRPRRTAGSRRPPPRRRTRARRFFSVSPMYLLTTVDEVDAVEVEAAARWRAPRPPCVLPVPLSPANSAVMPRPRFMRRAKPQSRRRAARWRTMRDDVAQQSAVCSAGSTRSSQVTCGSMRWASVSRRGARAVARQIVPQRCGRGRVREVAPPLGGRRRSGAAGPNCPETAPAAGSRRSGRAVAPPATGPAAPGGRSRCDFVKSSCESRRERQDAPLARKPRTGSCRTGQPEPRRGPAAAPRARPPCAPLRPPRR